MQIISRKDAKASGLKRYFTGKPCKHGHVVERKATNGECCECGRLSLQKNRTENRDEYLEKRRAYKNENKERINEVDKAWRTENRVRVLEYYRKYYRGNRDEIHAKEAIKRDNNRDAHNARAKAWRDANIDRVNAHKRKRRKTDPLFKLSLTCGNMLHRVLRLTGDDKDKRSVEMLGYTPDDLKTHLESLFLDGMTWENYGEWHIDHVIPVTILLEMGITEPNVINELENLQPLWARDNISKGNRFVG